MKAGNKKIVGIVVGIIVAAVAIFYVVNSNRRAQMQPMKTATAVQPTEATTETQPTAEVAAQPSTEIPVESFNPMKYVTLGDYHGISVSLKVTKEDLDTEIEELLSDYENWKPTQGKVKDGDTVYASYAGFSGGAQVDSSVGADYITIGSGEEAIPGIEASMLQVNTGDTAIVTLHVPAGTYGDPSLDDQDIEYHITPEYLCKKPTYTDAFVKRISKEKYTTTSAYDEHLTKKLAKEFYAQRAENTWTEVMSVCSVSSYPESLVNACKYQEMQNYYSYGDLGGMTHDEVFQAFGYEGEEDFVKNGLDDVAQETAKEYLVSQAIAKKEGIQYTDEDYQATLSEEFSYVNDQFATAEDFAAVRPGYLERSTIVYTVKNWLAEQAKYTY